jgi:hypothetical protein
MFIRQRLGVAEEEFKEGNPSFFEALENQEISGLDNYNIKKNPRYRDAFSSEIVEVEEDDEVGNCSFNGKRVCLVEEFSVNTPTMSLKGDRGIDESVCENPCTALQIWTDDLIDVFGSVGCEEKQLGTRGLLFSLPIKQEFADFSSKGSSTWLSRIVQRPTGRNELCGKKFMKRSFAASINAFEGDECGRFREGEVRGNEHMGRESYCNCMSVYRDVLPLPNDPNAASPN